LAVLAAVLYAAGLPTAAVAQDEDELTPLLPPGGPEPPDWSAWANVARLRAESVAELVETYDRTNQTSRESGESREVTRARYHLDLASRYRRSRVGTESAPGSVTFDVVSAEGDWSLARNHDWRTQAPYAWEEWNRYRTTGDYTGQFVPDGSLTLDLEQGNWEFMTIGQYQGSQIGRVQQRSTGARQDWSSVEQRYVVEPFEEESKVTHFEHGNVTGKLPKRPQPFGGVVRIPSVSTTPPAESLRVTRVQFWPEFDDVELEVRIEGYADWRPLGRIDAPGQPGGQPLTIIALLRSKTPGRPPPRAELLRFQLQGTSREPGVALNWPLGARDIDPDLRLAIPPAYAGKATMQNERQIVDFTGAESLAPSGLPGELGGAVLLESLDFGGRARLRVVARLADGRSIVGEFKQHPAGATASIGLPYARSGQWIAESWRRAKGVAGLAENADDEPGPAGSGCDGDGFTLYEEYRGWAVAGRHREGDPQRKDFFVLNLAGADAEPGIEIFEQLTGLRVHSDLRRSEMSEDKRLMNGNRTAAPRRVEQHGVWIKALRYAFRGEVPAGTSGQYLGMRGANTVGTAAARHDRPFRPGLTMGIGILVRDHPESFFNQPNNLLARDAIFQYDYAIAHELLHSVGVEHHGEGSSAYSFSFRSQRDPRNTTGRAGYFWGDRTPVTVLRENGHDMAAEAVPRWGAARNECVTRAPQLADLIRSMPADSMRHFLNLWGVQSPEEYLQNIQEICDKQERFDLMLSGEMGKPGSPFSGHQDCVMRYYFANLYPARGRADTYYLVEPGTEHVAFELCESPVGTGINAPGRRPQSRYGDAAAGRGNCAAMICPNDAIPP
jgi:hypothetical protein